MSANGSNPHSLQQQNSYLTSQQESAHSFDQQNFNRNQGRLMLRFPDHTFVSKEHNPENQHTLVSAHFGPPIAYGGYMTQPQFQPHNYMLQQQRGAWLPPQHFQASQQALNSGISQQIMGSMAIPAAPGQPQPVMSASNGSLLVSTAAPAVSGTPVVANIAVATGPASITPLPTASSQQRQSTLTRKKQLLSIVNPNTKEIINKSALEGQDSSSNTDEKAKSNEPKMKGRSESDDGKSVAEAQHRFSDAVMLKAFGSDSLQQSDAEVIKETDGSSSFSAFENDTFVKPVNNGANALMNAVKEKLIFGDTKSISSSPEAEFRLDVTPAGKANEKEAQEESEHKTSNAEDVAPSRDNECNGKADEGAILENGLLESESMEAKVKRYEEDFAKLMEDPKDTDLDALVYGSQFLRLMRNMVKEFCHVKCPKTEAELTTIGIDRAGMPMSVPNKKPYDSGNKGTFFPAFMQAVNTQSRMGGPQRPNNYVGRHSHNDKQLRPKKQISGRTSMDRLTRNNPQTENVLPRKSANAWRPSREVRPSDEAEAEKLKYEKLRKEIRGLLNKITPSTYDILAEEFVGKKFYEDKQLLDIVVDLIFDKAVEEPHFCPLYSDLCKRQVDIEYQLDEKPVVSFRKILLLKCQTTFTASTMSDEQIQAAKAEMEQEGLEQSKRDEIKEKIEQLKSKEKRRLNGIIRFIAELYRHNLLINDIVNWCAVELVKRYDKTGEDVYIEYAVSMIERVGAHYEKKKQKENPESSDQEAIDKVFIHLTGIKSSLSNRVRFMIMDLEDLRKNNWVPRHGNTGPKTIEEVHNEVVQEQLVNQQEREAYEKKNIGRDLGGRKGGGKYTGRGSTDNRSYTSNVQTERRSQAALNSIQTGSSALKKDMDLKKFEDQQKLGLSRGSNWSFGRKGVLAAESSTRTSTPPTTGIAQQSSEDSPPAAALSQKATEAD